MEIKGRDGTIKQVIIGQFSAMDGWELQMRFKEFAATKDAVLKRAYTYEILAYAQVVISERQTVPLSTDALVDNHLETWENVREVFEGVLMFNGINPNTHANAPHFWADAGAEMAIAFIAQCTSLLGPAMEMVNNKAAE